MLPYESPAHPEPPAVEVVEPVSQPDVSVIPGPEPVNTRVMKKGISVWLTKFAMWPGDYPMRGINTATGKNISSSQKNDTATITDSGTDIPLRVQSISWTVTIYSC